MIRTIVLMFCAMTLAACDKAPAAPNPPVAPAAPEADPGMTYQCSSPQKSGTVFLRFADDGALSMGAAVASLKPTGNVVKFDESGQTNWITPVASGYDSDSFNRGTLQWIWQEMTTNGVISDQANYSCKLL